MWKWCLSHMIFFCLYHAVFSNQLKRTSALVYRWTEILRKNFRRPIQLEIRSLDYSFLGLVKELLVQFQLGPSTHDFNFSLLHLIIHFIS